MISPPWVVLKFGGTSVSSLACWETIAKVVRRHLADGLRPLVVCSAVSQVSNQLEAAVAAALEGEDPRERIEALRARHDRLATELAVDPGPPIDACIETLERLLRGAWLTGEASPRLTAQIVATGELLSTRLGAVWLAGQGIDTRWLDARELLAADPMPDRPDAQYLSATCGHTADTELQRRLGAIDAATLLTQGFIARAPDGSTALLGRGGSDTSAAYLAAALDAARIEVWTDVAGLFSADPRRVPGAQRLPRLGYAEASEVTTRGAKVLHPRCLEPARNADIPIHIRCTNDPDAEGTVISADGSENAAEAIAIATRGGMTVVDLGVESSWQQVGVLANITRCFARHGYSIDSIASSQTRITIALDPLANPAHDAAREALVAELGRLAQVRIIAPVASISIIGTQLASVLHALPSLFEYFKCERDVYLLSHAANNRSFTFVVDECGVDAIVDRLHTDLRRARAAHRDGMHQRG